MRGMKEEGKVGKEGESLCLLPKIYSLVLPGSAEDTCSKPTGLSSVLPHPPSHARND